MKMVNRSGYKSHDNQMKTRHRAMFCLTKTVEQHKNSTIKNVENDNINKKDKAAVGTTTMTYIAQRIIMR